MNKLIFESLKAIEEDDSAESFDFLVKKGFCPKNRLFFKEVANNGTEELQLHLIDKGLYEFIHYGDRQDSCPRVIDKLLDKKVIIKESPQLEFVLALRRNDVSAKLVKACMNKDFKGVKEAVKAGADISFFNNAPIKEAIKSNDLKIVDYLLNLGVNVSERENNFPVYANLAARYAGVKMFDRLIEAETPLNSYELLYSDWDIKEYGSDARSGPMPIVQALKKVKSIDLLKREGLETLGSYDISYLVDRIPEALASAAQIDIQLKRRIEKAQIFLSLGELEEPFSPDIGEESLENVFLAQTEQKDKISNFLSSFSNLVFNTLPLIELLNFEDRRKLFSKFASEIASSSQEAIDFATEEDFEKLKEEIYQMNLLTFQSFLKKLPSKEAETLLAEKRLSLETFSVDIVPLSKKYNLKFDSEKTDKILKKASLSLEEGKLLFDEVKCLIENGAKSNPPIASLIMSVLLNKKKDFRYMMKVFKERADRTSFEDLTESLRETNQLLSKQMSSLFVSRLIDFGVDLSLMPKEFQGEIKRVLVKKKRRC